MALQLPLHFSCSTLGLRKLYQRSTNSNASFRFSSVGRTSASKPKAGSDDEPFLMSVEERAEMRRKIREMLDKTQDPEEETDPVHRKIKMEKLLADYPLVVEEDDPDWPEDAHGRGFPLDQFFKPVRDVTAEEWEDTVFKDFNPLVVLIHNRYKRPRENEMARNEVEKAVKMFWETGLPSPRCVAVDAVVEQDLVAALQVSVFPEILFTKAGKILHRDKVVRTAEEWSKIMAFFYYKAVRPPCLSETAGQSQEKIPSL